VTEQPRRAVPLEESRYKRIAKALVARAGYRIQPRYPGDFDKTLVETIERVAPYTQTTPEGVAATCQATEYVVKSGIVGACVECGVWKGGSMMAIALTLLRLGDTGRDLYLFDTFAGMPEPGEADVTVRGASATGTWERKRRGDVNDWNYVSLDDVRDTLLATGYPGDRLHFVKGRVEETLPDAAPPEIALLRLDTDWYESTRHELVNLFPRLSPHGVLIIDDYGFWRGARKATDEYFESQGIPIMLSRIDVGARIAVKKD
jgi:O-methyltransferase